MSRAARNPRASMLVLEDSHTKDKGSAMPKGSSKSRKAPTRAAKKPSIRVSADAALAEGAPATPVADVGGALERKHPRPQKVGARPAARGVKIAAGGQAEAKTIVYIHGIGNKPPASVLKCQWDMALFGIQLGDRSRLAYWVNREYYPSPEAQTCASGDVVEVPDDEASTLTTRALAGAETDLIEAEIEALTRDPRQREILRRLARRIVGESEAEAGAREMAVRVREVSARVLPLPEFLRRRITERLTRTLLRDVNDFLFRQERRRVMEQSLTERLAAGGGPFVVVAHSQGTMIAYNVLRQLKKADCDVRLFVTIGSPLGLTEFRDVLRQWVGGKKLPVPPCVSRWVNVADRLDPVAIDSDLRGEFTRDGFKIENHAGFFLNPDSPRHPHSGTGYLRTAFVQDAVRETVGNSFAQEVGKFVIARDLVNNLENSHVDRRHQVLIQLNDPLSDPDDPQPLDSTRTQLQEAIRKLAGKQADLAQIESLKRFISANLTRFEIESLRTQFRDLRIDKVWRDATKTALIYESTHTVQARPANLGYGALGRDTRWAVLDTGIREDHPHFATHGNIVEQWDCTKPGAPKSVTSKAGKPVDANGHGTHVAAIIAGEHGELPDEKDRRRRFFGMAPQARIYGYKVLDDQGNGQDSWIIKALDHIGDLNEKSGELLIHGVNLSLGGSFDPSVFGCGHSPLCQELRRLWRQGVLVCLAAGNEGFLVIESAGGQVEANMDLTIGDPANLEESIAVGSVHKTNPHTYGISYFSSRGPTADGRRKPDCVAPGERIVSASHQFTPATSPRVNDLYVEMSGTSMATPHVSGVLAAFLSVRREFIGYPDRVKNILLANSTDLGRDPYMQGAGMPNLIKMLANT